MHNGIEYDKTILGGRCEHLAIVKNPRYEGAMIAVNAIDKTDGNFVTLKRKDGSAYKAHLIDDSKHVDSFSSYATYLRAHQAYKTLPDTTRELIKQWLDEIKDDVQAEIDEEDRLPQTTKGVCSFLSTVVNDKSVVIESIDKYHFVIQRPQKHLSYQQAQRIVDSLNNNRSIRMRVVLTPAGDSDSGAGFAVHVEVFKKENNMQAQNLSNEEGGRITVKGAHCPLEENTERLGLDGDEVRETNSPKTTAHNSIVNKTKDALYDVMSRTIVEHLKQNGYL